MILKYVVDGKEIVKTNIVKFWQGTTHTRYQFSNGQIHEVDKIEQFYILPQ